MHPWLVYNDTFRVPTYFAMLMIGLAIGTFVLRREADRRALAPRIAMDCALVVLPCALAGARLFHVIVEQPGFYLAHPLLVLSPDGGWTFYGGLMGALAGGVAFARRVGVDPWVLCDLFAPATALGLVFGRIGCLGGGCCYGRPASFPLGIEVPWAIRYVERGQLPDELLATPLHPAPVYEALLCIGLFTLLQALAARQRASGEVLLAFLAGYGVLRALVEVFRADAVRGMWLGGWLSTSQIVGLVSALAALALWRRRRCTPSSAT